MQDIVNYIIANLKQDSFHILRYDSYSTDSIYLKLDYGACNSIRISNHKGKGHLHYLYNVDLCETNKMYIDTSGKYPRRFYGVACIDKMLQDIRENKLSKIKKYGTSGYEYFKLKNQEEHKTSLGFWTQSYEV